MYLIQPVQSEFCTAGITAFIALRLTMRERVEQVWAHQRIVARDCVSPSSLPGGPMASTLRKAALRLTIPVIAMLMAVNAYVITKNLKHIQTTTNNRVDAAVLQADIANVLFDLDEMETGQRGYLLTGDASYLRPFIDGKAKLSAHFSRLRSGLTTNFSRQERSLEAQLESVAQAKIAEMEETIRLRQQGYRHRALLLVNSNRGKELMDQARTALNALSSAQSNNNVRHDRDLKDAVREAYRELALAYGILLTLTFFTLLAFNAYSRRLEIQCAHRSEELRVASAELERLTSTMSHDFRGLVTRTRSYANALCESYGGFLPRQGQEQAECIEDGTGKMNRLLDDLFEERPSEATITEARRADQLSA